MDLSADRERIRARIELFFIWVCCTLCYPPCRERHHGCAFTFLVDPDHRYALNSLRVLTTVALAPAAKNGL